MLRFVLWARWLLFPAGLALALWLLFDLTGSQQLDVVTIPWTAAGVAFGLNLVYVLVYALMWHAVTRVHGIEIALPAALATFLYANVGKYLPFKIAGMALRIAIYSQRFGRDAVMTTKAVYVETLAALLGGLLVGAALLPWVAGHYLQFVEDWWLYALVALALVVLLLPITQRAALRWLFKLLRKEAPVIEEGPGAYVRLTLGYGLAWILLGTSLFVLCLGFAQGASVSVWLLAIEAYVIAGVAGMVSVIVPSGIGVREGVMVLGLTPLLGVEQSIVAAILARVTISLAELIGILGGFVYLEKQAAMGGRTT